MGLLSKKCSSCGTIKTIDLDPKKSDFSKDATEADGFDHHCKACRSADKKARRQDYKEARAALKQKQKSEALHAKLTEQQLASERRKNSDFAALKPEDFATGVANDYTKLKALRDAGKISEKTFLKRLRVSQSRSHEASKEKRQEWSEAMGAYAEAIQSGTGLDKDLGEYIGALAEQERRFANRRLSRSVSISAAHAELDRELFKQIARQFFSDKIKATGYATKTPPSKLQPRTVNVLLSDLHLGANMDERANPLPYRAVEEARRLEYLLRQVLDYKPQYREQSRLKLYFDGDVIDGMLLHDQRAGLPLSEQKAVFWHLFRIFLAHCAAAYKIVEVECQPGNHGRNIARHPGRATEDKWDGIEWDMYYALSCMCSGLPNVKFNMPFRAVSIVDLYGSKMLVTHGDTEPGFLDPDSGSEKNAATMAQINSSLIYGVKFDCYAVGHFHKGRYLATREPQGIFNGALVPPNGHARSNGMIGEKQGQWIWESVEGYPIGDARFVVVGPAQDNDEKLGKILTPFRLPKPTKDSDR